MHNTTKTKGSAVDQLQNISISFSISHLLRFWKLVDFFYKKSKSGDPISIILFCGRSPYWITMKNKTLKFSQLAAFMVVFFFSASSFAESFKTEQLRFPRVRTALEQKQARLKGLFADQGVKYPPEEVFIRIFKQEKVLELWALSSKGSKFHKINTYPICSSSGKLGPKRMEGDFQVPEGFYYINRFNPASNFYLSLGINYPNASDKILGVQGKLGGDIFIHGSCVTIGCVPITDNLIKELYLAAMEARAHGQKMIPVHIFPTRLDVVGMKKLRDVYSKRPGLISFWESLKPGYDFFEKEHSIPGIQIDGEGSYKLRR